MSAHTPGPWAWKEDITDRYDMPRLESDSGEICNFGRCEQYYPTEGEPPNEADMALIAASPDLLAVAKHAQEWTDPESVLGIRLAEVIAKATGGAA